MMHRTDADVLYDPSSIRFLEHIWGQGFMSPGGTAEIDAIVSDISLKDCDVLDFGCGAGGATMYLAKRYAPATLTGFDVERPSIELARKRQQESGPEDETLNGLSFVLGEPGKLPFDDGAFDVLFSKEVFVHIPDKRTLFEEIYRVLRPGGQFAVSDWLISHDDAPSAEMAAYFSINGLDFSMRSLAHYTESITAAGFIDVRSVSRNAWAREFSHGEFDRMSGRDYEKLVAEFGEAFMKKKLDVLEAKLKVLNSGEHCPTHLFGVKPNE